ncbi:alpha/beta hydrolase [Streptomyces curacoi]|nr:alpha/beta hydrolase [Streptomyces curacoi]
MAEQRMPPFDQVGVPTTRELMSGLRQAQGPAETVEKITETHIPGPAGLLPVRVYMPVQQPGRPRPLMVFFHGGGWIAGDVELLDTPLRSLANATGAVVASVEYRRAPETRFPGPAEDAYAAVKALAVRTKELGADGRLVIAGESAGGNLAAAACLMARDRGGPHIDLQVLICPPLAPAGDPPFPSYDQYATGHLNTRASMDHFWNLYLPSPEEAVNPYASPLLAEDHAGLPPALILTAECDPLRDEAEEYARRLRSSHVTATTQRYNGALHVFFLLPWLTAAQQARQDITAALRAHCAA